MKKGNASDLTHGSADVSFTKKMPRAVDPSRVKARDIIEPSLPDERYQAEVGKVARGWQNRDMDE